MKKTITSKEPIDVLNPQKEDEPIPIKTYDKEHSGNIMLISWVLCGVVFFIGLFARRLYLLEIVFPTLALVGFVSLGFVLLKTRALKQKQQQEKEEEDRRLERLRIEKLYKKPPAKSSTKKTIR